MYVIAGSHLAMQQLHPSMKAGHERCSRLEGWQALNICLQHVHDSFWWRIDISLTRARRYRLLGYVTFQDGTLFWLTGPHMSSNGSNASASRASSSSLTDTELMAP